MKMKSLEDMGDTDVLNLRYIVSVSIVKGKCYVNFINGTSTLISIQSYHEIKEKITNYWSNKHEKVY